MFNNTTSYKSSSGTSYLKKTETKIPKGNGNVVFLIFELDLYILREITRASERLPAVTAIQLTTFTINLLAWNFWEQIICWEFCHSFTNRLFHYKIFLLGIPIKINVILPSSR